MNTPKQYEGSRRETGVSGPSGGRGLRGGVLGRLREALRTRPEALDFAESVTLHLSHPPGGPGSPEAEHEAAERVVRLLDAAPAGPEEAARFATDPELLASVFQNIDLLSAHAYPGTDSLALLVMAAVEIADRTAR